MELIIAAAVGLPLPIIARWFIVKEPLKKWHAVAGCALVFFITNTVIVVLEFRGFGEPGIVSFLSYIVMRWGASKISQNANTENQSDK